MYTPSNHHFKAFLVSKLNSDISYLYQLFKENSNFIVLNMQGYLFGSHVFMHICSYVCRFVCMYERQTSQGDFRLNSLPAQRLAVNSFTIAKCIT